MKCVFNILQVLSDKVAILHNGALLADGSVSYLKKKFDAGFHLIVKHKRNTIYNYDLLNSHGKQQVESVENSNLIDDSPYKLLCNHVKSFVMNAKDLNGEIDEDGGYGWADQINYIQDESLLSRFHLPYVSEDAEKEEDNLNNIRQLLVSLDEDRKENVDRRHISYSNMKEKFNIDSYILDCTSLEQIFMALLHVSKCFKENGI